MNSIFTKLGIVSILLFFWTIIIYDIISGNIIEETIYKLF